MRDFKGYTKSVVIWFFIAVAVGAVTGVVGALFHKVIEFATHTRNEYSWLIYLMPVGGILIAGLYSLTKESLNTNTVFDCVRERRMVSPLLAPFIFVSAFITHLVGGSAGREGAALQIGGSLAAQMGRALRIKAEDMSTIIICGMSGAFAAIFTTPVTAAVFAYEVISVGKSRYYELLPSLIAAITGYLVTMLMGNEVLSYEIAALSVDWLNCFKIAGIAMLTGFVSILFCVSIKKGDRYFEEWFKNAYLRAVAGGIIVIVLTLICRTYDYNGAGMNIIEKALNGEVKYEAFILKLVFTVVTIASGYKGGEIVPAFFIGATFGAAVSGIFGIAMPVAAAMGMCAMFCGITNCPIASIVLGVELFGADNLIFFAIACAVSYVASGYFGLYKSQKIVYSKTVPEKINIFTK